MPFSYDDNKFHRREILGLGIVVLGGIVGCAKWSNLQQSSEIDPNEAKEYIVADEAIGIDSVFLRLTSAESTEIDKLIGLIDLQAFDIETRRRLNENGIFASVIRGEVPLTIRHWLESNELKHETDLMEQTGLKAEISSQTNSWQLRPNVPKEIAVRKESQLPIVVLHYGDELTGKTYELSQLNWVLYADHSKTGAVSIRLIPEILHGETKPNFVGHDYAMRREFKKESARFDDLRIETVMHPGEVIMLTCTETPRGIGEHFFTTRTIEGDVQRVVMLFRLANAQSLNL